MPRAGTGTWSRRSMPRCASSSCTAPRDRYYGCASPELLQLPVLVDQRRSVFWGRRYFPLHFPLLPCAEPYLTSSTVAAVELIT